MRIKMPPGTYYVGDPCYCFNDSWDGLLKQTDYFREPVARDSEDVPFVVAFSTEYGDGTYYDDDGRSYGVDAGLLGLVRVGSEDRSPRYAGVRAVTFARDINCYIEDEAHVIVFNDGLTSIRITTGREEDKEEEEEDLDD
jgi:hypothetical protein